MQFHTGIIFIIINIFFGGGFIICAFCLFFLSFSSVFMMNKCDRLLYSCGPSLNRNNQKKMVERK